MVCRLAYSRSPISVQLLRPIGIPGSFGVSGRALLRGSFFGREICDGARKDPVSRFGSGHRIAGIAVHLKAHSRIALGEAASRMDYYLMQQSTLLGRRWEGAPSRLLCMIVGLNIIVFMAWQYALVLKEYDPNLWDTMMSNFSLGGFESIIERGAWFSILGANFSHINVLRKCDLLCFTARIL